MYTTKEKGFTIVELLIVIVVIAILAAISIVAFTGIQQRGRDSARTSDVSNIGKALVAMTSDGQAWPATAGDATTALDAYTTANLDSSVTSRLQADAPTPGSDFEYQYTPCGSSPITGASIVWYREGNTPGEVTETFGTGC